MLSEMLNATRQEILPAHVLSLISVLSMQWRRIEKHDYDIVTPRCSFCLQFETNFPPHEYTPTCHGTDDDEGGGLKRVSVTSGPVVLPSPVRYVKHGLRPSADKKALKKPPPPFTKWVSFVMMGYFS